MAEAALSAISEDTGLTFVTRVFPHNGIEFSKKRYHNYRANNPDRPFCKVYIEPKLANIRNKFPALVCSDDTGDTV